MTLYNILSPGQRKHENFHFLNNIETLLYLLENVKTDTFLNNIETLLYLLENMKTDTF